jgi:hypothetical protein
MFAWNQPHADGYRTLELQGYQPPRAVGILFLHKATKERTAENGDLWLDPSLCLSQPTTYAITFYKSASSYRQNQRGKIPSKLSGGGGERGPSK